MKTYGLRNIFWDNANEDVFRTQSNIYDGVFSLKKHLALDHLSYGTNGMRNFMGWVMG